MIEEVFIFTASHSQQRLWFLDQLSPGNAVYNLFDVVVWRGALQVGVLERSINELIERHEALRTTFASVEGEPVQVIAGSLRLGLPVVDLSLLSARECVER